MKTDEDILHYYPLAKTPKSGGDRSWALVKRVGMMRTSSTITRWQRRQSRVATV
uniref:Uncharacterized protein n=1 Tax=Oryza sativa subsp. japonica TaxID=39947 RepID=Q6Z5P7_ORYSJ|nr:hypothetical protein [Oryza sativa Japonica Group]